MIVILTLCCYQNRHREFFHLYENLSQNQVKAMNTKVSFCSLNFTGLFSHYYKINEDDKGHTHQSRKSKN